MPTKRVRVTQPVRGTRERVFRAFSDPKVARKWAPEGCRMVSFEADMRVGRTFRQAMRCEGDLHVAHGEYRKIVPDEEVAFTHQWEEERPVETLVTVKFKNAKGEPRSCSRRPASRPRRWRAAPRGLVERTRQLRQGIRCERSQAAVDRRRMSDGGIPVEWEPSDGSSASSATAGRRGAGTPRRT